MNLIDRINLEADNKARDAVSNATRSLREFLHGLTGCGVAFSPMSVKSNGAEPVSINAFTLVDSIEESLMESIKQHYRDAAHEQAFQSINKK